MNHRALAPEALSRMAAVVAAGYEDKGAVVLSMGADGLRIGAAGLSAAEIQEALCVAIHRNQLYPEIEEG